MQRIFAADSPEMAQRACFAGSVGTLVVGVPFALGALSSGAILEAGSQYGLTYASARRRQRR